MFRLFVCQSVGQTIRFIKQVEEPYYLKVIILLHDNDRYRIADCIAFGVISLNSDRFSGEFRGINREAPCSCVYYTTNQCQQVKEQPSTIRLLIMMKFRISGGTFACNRTIGANGGDSFN